MDNIPTEKIGTSTNKNWMQQDLDSLGSSGNYEKLPALKFEKDKLTEIEIDFSKQFEKYKTENNGKPITKAIIPCKQAGEKKIFWLNVKNPLYKKLLELGKKGITKVKIVQTGVQAETRYSIIE